MRSALLDAPEVKFWRCPSCGATERQVAGITIAHRCPAHEFLTVPLAWVKNPTDVPDVVHRVIEREDYIGDSGGQRVMAVRLERADGSYDTNVYAPTAEHSLAQAWGGPGAWSASAIFAYAVYSSLTKAMNWSSDSLKVALYNNTGTPDKTVTTAVLTEYNGSGSQWVTANEVSQSGQWAAGGVALAGVTVTQSTNVITFNGSNTSSGSAATLSNVYGCLVYDTTVSSQGLCFNYLGGANAVSGGTFTVVWNSSGIATFTT